MEDVTKDQRQLGKVAILGLGFGMGDKKFVETCASWGIPITSELSQKTVTTYRTRFYKVRDFWYACQKAAIDAIENPGKIFSVGKIGYKLKGDYLICRLPSGRKIVYFNPGVEIVEKDWGPSQQIYFYGEDSISRQWGKQTTYGGKLVENITQAVARDIMAEAMLRVEEAGYPVIMTVHDEIVCEKEKGDLKEFERLMAIIPEWAEGLPVAVEGWKAKRYKK